MEEERIFLGLISNEVLLNKKIPTRGRDFLVVYKNGTIINHYKIIFSLARTHLASPDLALARNRSRAF